MILLKFYFDEARFRFQHCLSVQGDYHGACTQKWCHFSLFSIALKKPKTWRSHDKRWLRESQGAAITRFGGPRLGFQLIKGSVERSLLPRAIFLIFTQNKPWKSEDHRCTLFFIEMSKERLEKSERTPPVSWRPWALAYSRDRPYNFSYLSAVSKNRLLAVFSRLWGVIWRGKAFLDQQCQFLTRNKSLSSENESNCSMTSEYVRTDSILPPRRRPRARSM